MGLDSHALPILGSHQLMSEVVSRHEVANTPLAPRLVESFALLKDMVTHVLGLTEVVSLRWF